MRYLIFLCAVLCFAAASSCANDENSFRPPAVPLVVHDPYFSIWSPADKLTDSETVHWTGAKHPLHAMIRLGDKTYRLMGSEPKDVTAMKQTKRFVFPTRTLYVFECEEATVTLQFITPVLPSDLDLLSRPITYIICEASAKGNQSLAMAFYFDAGGEIAVNTPEQKVQWSKLDAAKDGTNTETIKLGTVEQNVLGRKGDNVRIDWGHLILSAAQPLGGFKSQYSMIVDRGETLRKAFIENKIVPKQSSYPDGASVEAKDATIAFAGFSEQPQSSVQAGLILAYDDEYSIRYFEDDLRPWWKRNGKSTEQMLTEAWKDALAVMANKPDNLLVKCGIFDTDFMTDLAKVGGADYGQLCALVYRQSLGAQKIVADKNGMPLMFSKENFSNGSIGTVDLMYPASPMLLYYSPALVKATLQPILDYGMNKRWKFPFAPHDIGTYPHATGQTYGGGETSEKNQMPVEESANMLIQVAALAVVEGNTNYAKQHWTILTKWAEYLLEKGYDPENQLCTDDFAGHLAHNINLSVKAIVGLGSYAQLADKLGEKEVAAKYHSLAASLAKRWITEATEDDHTKLAFDKPGTWSMKYNLLWDEILGLKLFPREVIDKEIAYYKTKSNKFGLPLDNRSLYTKNDWILWTAALTNNRADFDALVQPVVAFANTTEQRVPLSDWYFTDTAKQKGFQARSVVGGFWAPMLKNTERWKAQAKQGADVPRDKKWAPLTVSEVVGTLVPTAQTEKPVWLYTFEKPADNWNAEDFDAAAWKEGKAGFGTEKTPGAIISTVWNSDDIWLRRTFELKDTLTKDAEVRILIHHDEDVEVYLNGKLILQRTGYTSNYTAVKSSALKEALRTGKNTFAVHCRQTTGGQYIDVGVVLVKVE